LGPKGPERNSILSLAENSWKKQKMEEIEIMDFCQKKIELLVEGIFY